MGNMTRDIEIRTTESGLQIGGFGLAVNRKWKDKNGVAKEEVMFADITAFGVQAEVLAKYTQKGSPLYVAGRLKLDQWEDKETGAKRSKMGIILESFQFLGSAQSDEKPAAETTTSTDIADDDVPF